MELSDVLRAPAAAETVEQLAGPPGVAVDGVRLATALDELEQAPAEALVVLTAAASAEAAGFRFDVALRVASSRGVRAIVLLTDEPQPLTSTAAELAQRGGVAVLRAPAGTDVADLVFRLRAQLAGGAAAAVSRLGSLLDALGEGERAEVPADALLGAAGAAIDAPLSYVEDLGETPPPPDGVPVVVDGVAHGWLRFAEPERAPGGETGRAVLALAADALARAEVRARRRAEAPIESRAELLTELLMTDQAKVGPVLHRIRAAGIPIDGWHVAARLDVHADDELARDELARLDLATLLARLAIDTARASGGMWYRASAGLSGLLLVRTDRVDPGPRATGAVADVAGRVMSRLHARVPGLVFHCGVSSVHAGAPGLRTAAAEARAAASAARTAGRVDEPVLFDAVGLRRMLVEWYASESTREEVDALLAPLDELDERRAATAIETLRCYLDNQGSLTKTGAELHLHRNAVAYRVGRIQELLGVDLDDPDQRLILHLACRARSFA